MTFDPGLIIGQEIDNDKLVEIFKCSPQSGMRKSKRTGTLVIVSDYTHPIYNNRWEKDILHYTAMGQTGDQSLETYQNKELLESDTNGLDVFLFEKFKQKIYTYQGQAKIAGKPYQEKQYDIKKKLRKVWIIPLKLIDGEAPSISNEIYISMEESKQKFASKLSIEELKERIKHSSPKKGSRNVVSTQRERSSLIQEFTLKLANGICQLCQSTAPFNKKDNSPYLEVHHIEWLARDGADSIENTVALCPNCHRKMHFLDLDEDKEILLQKAKNHSLD